MNETQSPVAHVTYHPRNRFPLRAGGRADTSVGSLPQNNSPSLTVSLLVQSWLTEISEQPCEHLIILLGTVSPLEPKEVQAFYVIRKAEKQKL